VKYLIEHGADLDAGDSNGNTALTTALVLDYPGVAQTLVEAGATVDRRNTDASRPCSGRLPRRSRHDKTSGVAWGGRQGDGEVWIYAADGGGAGRARAGHAVEHRVGKSSHVVSDGRDDGPAA
jgi:hypothetical protein